MEKYFCKVPKTQFYIIFITFLFVFLSLSGQTPDITSKEKDSLSYKLVLITSPYRLSLPDLKNGDIKEIFEKGKYKYIIGPFSSSQEAIKYYKDKKIFLLVEELNKVLRLQDVEFREVLIDAELSLYSDDYQQAKTKYEKAFKIRPDEKFVQARFTEINSLLSDANRINQQNLDFYKGIRADDLQNLNFILKNITFDKENFPDKESEYKEAVKNLKKGDSYYKKHYFFLALEYFLKSYKFNPDNAELNFKIGRCLLETTRDKSTLSFFIKAYLLDPKIAPYFHFLVGNAFQLNRQWDDAIVEYEKYKSNLKDEKDIEFITKKIEECKAGKELMKSPLNVEIQNLGDSINTRYPDYSPIISPDESVIYFTSRRDNTTGGRINPKDFRYYEDIYVSSKKSGQWSKPENTSLPFNTKTNDATISAGWLSNSQKLIIYKDVNNGDIYEVTFDEKGWSKPTALPKPINSKHHEPFASFSPTGDTIFFVSDRPKDNFGGHDIFFCVKESTGAKSKGHRAESKENRVKSKGQEARSQSPERWSKAQNIGRIINTEYDETGVFMCPDGKTLYFSSKGHKNIGGYDLFRTVYNKEVYFGASWSIPENLGFPINSPNDDYFISLTSDGKKLYYSSNHSGYGSDDIYVVLLDEKTDESQKGQYGRYIPKQYPQWKDELQQYYEIEPEPTIIKGQILDAKTNKPVEAVIEVIDNETKKVVGIFRPSMQTGKYILTVLSGKKYEVYITAEGYMFYNEIIDIPKGTVYLQIEKDIYIPKVDTGVSITLRNISFDFDSYNLRPDSYSEIEYVADLMKSYPKMKVEISGHTDSKGSDEYNQVLSERRAKAVVDALVVKGVSTKRIKYVGYGEKRPIAPNTNPDGSDNPKNRELNRRIEFKILEM